MAATTGTMTIPIYAKFANKEFHVGDLTLDVKVVGGRPKAPTAREITKALKRGLI
jgi:hypothetical protein